MITQLVVAMAAPSDVAEAWMWVTLFYSPIALVVIAIVGLVAAIVFGKTQDAKVRPSFSAAFLSVLISAVVYCVGIAIFVLYKG